MSIESIQELVRVRLESQEHFVRANAHFKVDSATKTGKTETWSDVDILAIGAPDDQLPKLLARRSRLTMADSVRASPSDSTSPVSDQAQRTRSSSGLI